MSTLRSATLTACYVATLGALQNAQSPWCLGTHLITDKPSFKDKDRSTFA